MKRAGYVDFVKGFAMLAVILGHSPADFGAKKALYAFHLPLFFVCSGYVFALQPRADWGRLGRQAKRLVFGFFCILFVNYISWRSFNALAHKPSPELMDSLCAFFMGQRTSANIAYFVGTSWFLLAYLLASTLYHGILHCRGGALVQGAIVAVAAAGGVLLLAANGGALPWYIDVALLAAPFFWLGGRLVYVTGPGVFGKAWLLILALAGIVAGELVSVWNIRADLWEGVIGNPWLYYAAAGLTGLGIVVFVRTAGWKSSFVEFVGRNSFLFVLFHAPLANGIAKLVLARFPLTGALAVTAFYFVINVVLLSAATVTWNWLKGMWETRPASRPSGDPIRS